MTQFLLYTTLSLNVIAILSFIYHLAVTHFKIRLMWAEFARRHGLTHGALFVEAVDRWAMQEIVPRDRMGGMSDSPTLFDFANPLEVRVEPIATPINAPSPSAGHERAGEGTNVEGNIDDITAELVRLLEGSTESRAIEETADDRRNRAAAKPE